MPKQSKQLRQLSDARKRREIEKPDRDVLIEKQAPVEMPKGNTHWEGFDDEESEDDTSLEDFDDDERDAVMTMMAPDNAFEALLRSVQEARQNGDGDGNFHIKYSRGSHFSDRHERRLKAANVQKAKHAAGSHQISKFFSIQQLEIHQPPLPSQETSPQLARSASESEAGAITDMEKLLKSKVTRLEGANLMRHRAVLAFLYSLRRRSDGQRREDIALAVARSFNKNVYFSRKIVEWERLWITTRAIPESRRGCFSKVVSWLNDEGVELAVRDFIATTGESLTAARLAKFVGEYLGSQRVAQQMEESLSAAASVDEVGGRKRRRETIKVRTARRWLEKLGFIYSSVGKNVYYDGHERKDVIYYRDSIFLPKWRALEPHFVQFAEDGTWTMPSGLTEGDEPLVLCTHDESTFNANDGRGKTWMDAKKGATIRKKGQGRGIMISAFITPGGILRVPDHIPDIELLAVPDYPKTDSGSPVREAVVYLEYSKDNYWTGEKMVEQTVRQAIPIFKKAYPGCKAVFAFDNASNHCAVAPDALVASKMSLGPGGKQPKMKDGWNYLLNKPQSMIYAEDYPIPHLRGQPKGLKQVLIERGLWTDTRPDGKRFLGMCSTSNGRKGCPVEGDMVGKCCATACMASQPDFLAQKGSLEEKIGEAQHYSIFYPKFHCELNFIERVWCGAKHHARENCDYTFAGLRKHVPEALHAVTSATINRHYHHCLRAIHAYMDGAKYGTDEFQNRVYRSHRQVRDESKW